MPTYYVAGMPVTDELYHHGIIGQKWGVRRYQNTDGTLTAEGQKRYNGHAKNIQNDLNRLEREYAYAKGDEYKNQATYDRINKKTLKKYKKLTGREDLFEGSADDIQKRFAESGLRNTKNWKKTVEKQNRAMEGIEDAQKRQKEIESDTWRVMSAAMNQRMSVIATPKYRPTVRAGERMARQMLLGGAVGGAIWTGVDLYTYGGANHLQEKTNKFKVINDGQQQTIFKR